MVVFTCNECGQSVKKNQVENHCFQCRNCQSVSCMDCNKEFWGDDYKSHVKCITEDERYGGKNYQPKPSSNKGEIKQEKWIEHIKSTMATKKISGPLSGLLEQIILYSNIPRKKSKFENFLKNSLNVRNERLIGEAWEIFALSTKNESNSTSNPSTPMNGTSSVNGTKITNGTHSESTPGKKRAADSDEKSHKKTCPDSSQSSEESSAFDWCGISKKILQSFPSGIPEKKLRKQVIAEYKASLNGTCTVSDTELKKLFRHELSNNPVFSLYADKSKLPVN